jgi:hypothetical protein
MKFAHTFRHGFQGQAPTAESFRTEISSAVAKKCSVFLFGDGAAGPEATKAWISVYASSRY